MTPTEGQFTFLNHPDKIKVQAFGSDFKNLFANSASALMNFLYPKQAQYKNSETRQDLSLKAPNLEKLLVDWLSELLVLSSQNHCCYNEFDIAKITETELKAAIFGRRVRARQNIIGLAYQNLTIKKTSDGFLATMLFDV